MYKYCVDGSICHFKFSKVVLAQILGEVGILCTALLSVYSRTCLPIFIEINLSVTDTEQKKLARFLRHCVHRCQLCCCYGRTAH